MEERDKQVSHAPRLKAIAHLESCSDVRPLPSEFLQRGACPAAQGCTIPQFSQVRVDALVCKNFGKVCQRHAVSGCIGSHW